MLQLKTEINENVLTHMWLEYLTVNTSSFCK